MDSNLSPFHYLNFQFHSSCLDASCELFKLLIHSITKATCSALYLLTELLYARQSSFKPRIVTLEVGGYVTQNGAPLGSSFVHKEALVVLVCSIKQTRAADECVVRQTITRKMVSMVRTKDAVFTRSA